MNWPASIPIKQAALVFITGVLVLVSLIGGFALYETRSVSRNLAQASQAARQAGQKPSPGSGGRIWPHM